MSGTGKDLFRAGWGIYYDFGYTNANILFPGLSAQGGSGVIFTGHEHRRASRTLTAASSAYGAADRQHRLAEPGEPGRAVLQLATWPCRGSSSRSRSQFSIGWSHELTPSTVIDVDYVHVEGKDLGVRWPLNTITPAGTRRYASLGLQPGEPDDEHEHRGEQVRRLQHRHAAPDVQATVQLNAWYQWSNARGLGGLGLDELTTNLVQDATNPLADVQWGPSARTDARHKVTISAVINVPWGIYVSPIFRYRSALPLHIWTGYDVNADGANNDIYTTAYKFTGIDAAGNATVRGHRRVRDDQLRARRGALAVQPARRRRSSSSVAGARSRPSREIFNMFNAINPNFGVGAASSSPLLHGHARRVRSPNTVFMKPTAYSGDAGQPEQRVGQIGFRFTF